VVFGEINDAHGGAEQNETAVGDLVLSFDRGRVVVVARKDPHVLNDFARVAVHAAEGIAGGVVSGQTHVDAGNQEKGHDQSNEGVTLRRDFNVLFPPVFLLICKLQSKHQKDIENTVGQHFVPLTAVHLRENAPVRLAVVCDRVRRAVGRSRSTMAVAAL